MKKRGNRIFSTILVVAMLISIAPVLGVQASDTFTVEFGHTAGVGEVQAFVGGAEIFSGDAVAAGATVNFTATPSGQGFVVHRWTVNEAALIHNFTTHTVTNLSSNLYVAVEFAQYWEHPLNIPGSTNLAHRPSAANNPFNVIVSGASVNAGALTNIVNGTLSEVTTPASAFNTWGSGTAGTAANPYFLTFSWPEPHVITGLSALWWIFTDTGVQWPTSVIAEFSMDDIGHGTLSQQTGTFAHTTSVGAQQAARLAALNWTPIGPIGTGRNGNAPGATWVMNTYWNNVEFETPVLARHVRLRVVHKTSGSAGFGANQINVYGHPADLAQADINTIPTNFLQNLTSNVELPATGINGSTITWSGSTDAALTNEGIVTRPAAGQPNAVGQITATAVHPEVDEPAVRVFNFSVIREIPVAQTPVITAQPAAAATIDRDNPAVTLSVTANITDEGVLSYQWYRNTTASNEGGTPIEGATGSTFVAPSNEAGVFYYYCVVTNTNAQADDPVASVVSNVSTVTVVAFAADLQINPVNNLNPILQPGTGARTHYRFRSFFRYRTENTFLRPGEAVTYNHLVTAVGVDPNPVWTITGGVGSTAMNPATGRLTVCETQPAGPITVTATLGDLTASATVTVRIVNDENGFDRTAKWTAIPFELSEVTLTGDNVWTKNNQIAQQVLLQPDRIERHLNYFYRTAGITHIPVQLNDKPAGTPVTGLAAAQGWDGPVYASTSIMWQRSLAGHGTGHYMTGLAQGYQVARTEAQRAAFLERMLIMVDQLGFVQDTKIASGSYMYGFLSAYSEHQFDVLEENKAQVATNTGGSTRSSWAIFYTQHKIIQGLVDIYRVLVDCDNEVNAAAAQRALEIATKMGDWTYLRLSRWTQADRENMWNVYSDGEIGGIAQPILDLFFITGDELYREVASFFEHNNNWNNSGAAGQSVTSTQAYWTVPGTVRATTRSGDGFFAHFAKNMDGHWMNNRHANTIIPMIVSSLRQYEADQSVDTPVDIARINPVGFTPSPRHYYEIARNFFDTIFETRISPIGGSASGEIYQNFGNPVTPNWNVHLHVNAGNAGSNESCTTVNNMVLASELFRHEQRAVYFDYFEKALVNHVMPTLSQNQNSVTAQIRIDYQTSMSIRSPRNHSLYSEMSCCHGTGLEVHNRYQQQIFHRTPDNTGLFVNLYIPATLVWEEKGFEIVQENNFLNEGENRITVNGTGPLDINLRVPYWVERGFEVKVNGVVVIEDAPQSSYVTVSRNWAPGDVIEISMPFTVRIERSPQNLTDTRAIIFYGPYYMVQQPQAPDANRPVITGLNFADLTSGFTLGTRTNITHTFGNYSSFALVRGGQNYFPKYTATTTNTNFMAHWEIARDPNENVAVNFSVAGGAGTISSSGNNRALTNGQRVNRGTPVRFFAAPAVGYMIDAWYVNGLRVAGGVSDREYVTRTTGSDLTVAVAFVPVGAVEPADYSAVNAALEEAAAIDRALYTPASLAVMDAAVAAVILNLPATEQETVDAFAAAINAAIDALEPWQEVSTVRIGLNAITRVSRNSERPIEVTVNEGANPAEADNIVLTVSNPAMATIGEDGRTVITANRAGTVTLTATHPESGLRHSVTLMIT